MNFVNCRGLTLIEIMASVMILLITITGSVTTYSYLNKQVDKAQQRRFAVRFAQRRVEEWMADPNCEKEKSDNFKKIPFTGRLTISPDDDSSDYKKVECNVCWTDGNISLTTIWGK